MTASKVNEIVYEPVYKRQQLADLLEQYLVDAWTNDEMQDRICELEAENPDAMSTLYFQMQMLFDDFKTRRHSQWPTKVRAKHTEMIRRVILFLRSPLPYAVKPSKPMVSGRVLLLGAGFLLLCAVVSWRWTLLVFGWIALAWVLFTEVLLPLYKRWTGAQEPDEDAFWPFVDEAQYRAVLEAGAAALPDEPERSNL